MDYEELYKIAKSSLLRIGYDVIPMSRAVFAKKTLDRLNELENKKIIRSNENE